MPEEPLRKRVAQVKAHRYCWRMCVKNARDHIKRDAALEMEAGPPEPACRSRLQTTISCVGQKPGW